MRIQTNQPDEAEELPTDSVQTLYNSGSESGPLADQTHRALVNVYEYWKCAEDAAERRARIAVRGAESGS